MDCCFTAVLRDCKMLRTKIEELQTENKAIRQRVETVKQDATSEIVTLKQQFGDREQELIEENNEHNSTI